MFAESFQHETVASLECLSAMLEQGIEIFLLYLFPLRHSPLQYSSDLHWSPLFKAL